MEFTARLGQFSLLTSAERARVLAARTRAVHTELTHLETMQDLATAHGERWGAIVTTELIRRHQQELTWLAELAELAAQPEPAEPGSPQPGTGRDRAGEPRCR